MYFFKSSIIATLLAATAMASPIEVRDDQQYTTITKSITSVITKTIPRTLTTVGLQKTIASTVVGNSTIPVENVPAYTNIVSYSTRYMITVKEITTVVPVTAVSTSSSTAS